MTLVAETNAGISQRTQSDSAVRAAAPCESHEATRRMDPIRELFSSERMYARDLALVCNIHLPLAQGKPISKPGSSTLCSGSGSSQSPTSGFATSNSFAHPSPMTDDDVRSIFRNISDIASLSSRFVERLEIIFNRQTNEGGSDEDNVGKLFLDIIADLEPLYKTYLSTHSAALSRLQRFSQSSANQNYTSVIQNHLPPGTPDLASFLEKPKERIPEYCHLLQSIISHRDLTALTQARDQMERVARKLRNDRFVFPSDFSLKIPTISIRKDEPASTGADDLAQLEIRLRQYPIFLDDLARDVEDLAAATRRSVELLQQWSIAFGAVTLGLGPSQSAPPAYPTFTSLLSTLLDLCNTMESDLHMSFIPPIKKLKALTERPKQLLEEMHTLEPHAPSSPFAKIRRYFSKDRRRYTDLRSKLLVELPLLLDATDRAIGLATRIAIQVIIEILEQVRDKWMGFFNSMVEDDEHYGGVEETLRTWSKAWEDGRQKLVAWEEKYVLRDSTERDVLPGRSEAGLPALLAEVPPTNDVRLPAAPPDSGTKTSTPLSIFPQPATVRLPMKRRMTWPGLRAEEQNYRL